MSTTNSCILSGQGCGSATNFPQFIDTAACLCGLLTSRESDANGEQVELWRCIGDASGNLASGNDGKWFNTTLGSQELSGLAQPQNWGDNPPDTSQVYVLEDSDGKTAYQKLGSGGSSALTGNDKSCTGKNNTMLSGEYYGKNTQAAQNTSSSMMASSASPTMSSMASAAISSTSSTSSMMSSTTSSSSMATDSSTTSSTAPTSTSPSTTPSSTSKSSSAAPRANLKVFMLVGMVLAPLITMMT